MAQLDVFIGVFIGVLVIAYVTDGVPAPHSENSIPATKSFPSLKITDGTESQDWNHKQTWYKALKSYTDLGKLLYGQFKKILKDTSHPFMESTENHANTNLFGKDRMETEAVASLKNQTSSGSNAKDKYGIARGNRNESDLSQTEFGDMNENSNVKPKTADISQNATVNRDRKDLPQSGRFVIDSSVEPIDNSFWRQSIAKYAYSRPPGEEMDTVAVKLNGNQADVNISKSRNNQDIVANAYVETVATKRARYIIDKNNAMENQKASVSSKNEDKNNLTTVEQKQDNMFVQNKSDIIRKTVVLEKQKNIVQNSSSNLSGDKTGEKGKTTSNHGVSQLEATYSPDNQAGKTVEQGHITNSSSHLEIENTWPTIGNATKSNVLNASTTSNHTVTAESNQSNGTTPIESTTMEANQTSGNPTYITDVEITVSRTKPPVELQGDYNTQPIRKGHKSRKDLLRDGYGNRRNSNKYNEGSSSEELEKTLHRDDNKLAKKIMINSNKSN